MCKGRKEGEEDTTPIPFCKGPLKDGESINESIISCELCNSEASVYCQADDAFLCRKCDKWVHGANFLAQRHIRCLLCGVCKRLTRRFLIGTSSEVNLEQRSRRKTTPKESFLFL
ncbi:B-box domain protein 30-like [Lycium barbarum]|uniref:B-box domain protein 30-like n=1 Tax=Lycium barbarum TaxID=112863 RepID=UPI00293EDE7F|nr:B-box domain protein 30-like [Lycium barbarum]